MANYSIYARQSTRHAWNIMGHGTDYLDVLCRSVQLITDVKASWPNGRVAIGPMVDDPAGLPKNAKLDVLYPGKDIVGPNGRIDDCDGLPWREEPNDGAPTKSKTNLDLWVVDTKSPKLD